MAHDYSVYITVLNFKLPHRVIHPFPVALLQVYAGSLNKSWKIHVIWWYRNIVNIILFIPCAFQSDTKTMTRSCLQEKWWCQSITLFELYSCMLTWIRVQNITKMLLFLTALPSQISGYYMHVFILMML